MSAASAKLTGAATLALITMLQIPGCFPVPEYLLTIAVDEGGAIFLPPDESGYQVPFAGGAFPEGTELVLTARAEDGYRFVRWEGNVPPGSDPEDGELTITIESDMSLTAVFIGQFALAVDIDGEGDVEVDGEEVRVPYDEVFDDGSDVVLTATAAEGWRFVGWEGDVSGADEEDNPLHISVDSETSITAVFIREFTLTVDIEGEGSVEVDGEEVAVPFHDVFDDGSEVVLTATAAEGWHFVGWAGDYSGADSPADSPITVTMDDYTQVTAVFVVVAGHREVTADGVLGQMTLAVQGATVKGVWRFLDMGLDVDGAILGDEVTLTCSAPFTNPATITATIEADGSWSGIIDGSGFENDPFSVEPVDLAGSVAVRTTLLPGYGASATGRMAVVVSGEVMRGTWRMVGNFGVDVEGTFPDDQVVFELAIPGFSPATATGTVEQDGSWVGVLNGSGFEDEPFEADAPFFP